MSKILSIGLNLVDIYIDQKVMYPGGNEFNVSIYARRIGGESAFLGTFGDDETVPFIKQVLEKEHVDFSRCRDVHGPNGNSIIKLVDGERVFVGYNKGGVTGSQPITISEEDVPYISNFDVVTTSLYGRVPVSEIIKVCSTSVPVAYDFSNDWTEELREQLLPHLSFAFYSCADMNHDAIWELLTDSYKKGCGCNIATMGSEGALLYDGQRFFYQAPCIVDVVDTMGAGDSFIAAFLNEYFNLIKTEDNKDSIYTQSLQAAAKFAAETCTKNGAVGYSFDIPEGYKLSYIKL